MWTHPDVTGQNITAQFPEVFDKHDFLYFSLPSGRMANFFKSSQYLDASRRTRDIGKIFSAVQCAMQTDKHKSLEQFLKGKGAKEQLANALTSEDVGILLDELFNEYNDKYGMGRQIRAFYRENLDEDGRRTLLGKIPLPSHLWQSDANRRLDARVNFLLEMRNDDSHAATYQPLADERHMPRHCERGKGNPPTTWPVYLTFEDLHEITRRALAHLWLKEYETYWHGGGKEIIEESVARVQKQCDELNSRR
ncbi:hypothetical protein [Streptomyces sp. NPDC002156]